MRRKNPTSPIRTGFDYQDIFGLYLCVEWLKDPTKFRWIGFETIPDEVQDNKFYLDDIVQCDNEDFYYLYQVKHKQNPQTDLWTWDDLLEPKGKARKSLIKKWFDSYLKPELKDKIKSSMLVTNGSADANKILKYIEDGKIAIRKVKGEIPKVYSKLKEQLGDEDKINTFFDNFQFLFEHLELSELENRTRDSLQKELGATKSGIDNLLLQIHKECRQRYTRSFSVEQIQEWCEWDKPEPLNEKFEIPSDFVFFNETKHREILNDLKNPIGGIKVISGKPGTGKSTYLSKLHETLCKDRVISIRHHYHISPKESNPIERVNSNRVIEAIKAQIKQYPKELGTLAHKNSQNIPIRKYLDKIAQSLHKQGKNLVFIIDGLDHVLRYADERELKDFLNEVVFPQPGVWIVFGTQTTAKQYLPQIVLDKCPEDKWTEIKGLTKEGLCRIVDKNVTGLNLPDDHQRRQDIYNKLFELTEGNPLHLRYILKQLKNKLQNKLLTKFELNDLLPYEGDIAKYYSSLWNKISPPGKTLAVLIASAGFSLEKGHLLEVLQLFESNPSKITEGFDSISHLLEEDKNGVSIYHNSFETFIRSQGEYKEQEKSIKQHLKDWLENSNNEELKWAELRKLSYDLGDPEPILETDKNWLIDAICHPRDPKKIISQLELGAKASFERNVFGKTFELSNLNSYYQNSLNFVEEASEKIWEQAFNRRNPDVFRLNLSEYSPRKLLAIAELAGKQGKSEVIQDTIDILRDRHDSQEYTKKGAIGGHIPLISACLTRIVPFIRTHDVKRIHGYIKQFADSGWSSDLFKIYVDSLLRTKQFTKVSELLALDLTQEEKQEVLDSCAEYDLESQEKQFLEIIDKENHTILSPFCLLYLAIQDKKIKHVLALPEYEEVPSSVKEYETGKREENVKIFSNNFHLGIVFTLLGKENEIRTWMGNGEDRWTLNIMSKIFEASIQIAKQIKENNPIDYKEVFKKLASVKKLNFPEDRDLYELQFSLQVSLSSILKTIRLLKLTKKQSDEIDEGNLDTVILSKFYDRAKLLEFLLNLDTPCLSKEAYKSFMSDEKPKWKKLVTYFSDRAEHYADLAKLASIHRDDENCKEFLELAASNLLGYGYHKDMYLDGVLQSIQICHKAGSKKTNGWIKRIAPIVENVTDYTDGDETRYFPRDLARVLITVNPQLLYKYYYQKAQDEELFLAQDIFKYVLRSLRFNKDTDVALAITALDKDSFGELKTLSQTKKGAGQALKIIEDYFGKIEYQKKNSSSSTSNFRKEVKDYSLVVPKELEKYLVTIETEWDQREFFIPWAKYWLDKESVDKKEIYQSLVAVIEKGGLHNAEGEILDLLYPLAYEFDNGKAFDYLCWAQANDSGWNLYWTYKEKAEKRWDVIKKHDPDRYMEFFEKSIIYSGKRYGRGGSYFVPIPRGVEFLTLFDDLESIEKITEASVKFAESLMADLELPRSLWVTENSNIDVVDILFQRLLWPSHLVRERAATGIARMLISSQDKEQIFGRLLNWIKDQKLESVIAIGLLPILKAVERKDKAIKYISLEKVVNALPMTSIVIEKLIEELARLDTQINLTHNRKNIVEAPSDYCPGEFFKKYIKGFLAPIYLQRANKIKQETGNDFVKQWAYTSEEIVKECGIEEKVGDAMYFMGGEHSPILSGMSTILSEVYRSAFLRVLQYFHEQKLIPDDFYLHYAYATLPIELSYWKIQPDMAPRWWPKFKSVSSRNNGRFDLSGVGLRDCIDQIVKKKNEFKVIGIDGAVQPVDGWIKGEIDTSMILVAFGYKVIGKDMPDPKEVAKEILYSPQMLLIPRAPRPFNFLESYSYQISTKTSPIKVQDLILYPIVARNRDLVIALWQWFRDFSVPFGLSEELGRDLEVKLESNGWKCHKEKIVVAKSCDWLEGLKDRHDKDLEIPHGHYIEINSLFLDSYLKENRLRLGYVMKTVYKYKKYSYEEAKVLEDYQLLGVSRVII